jgi:flagellar assembly factor FliW
LQECEERLRQGSRVKTVVRFEDQSGILTGMAKMAMRMDLKDRVILTRLVDSQGWRRSLINLRSIIIANKKLSLAKQITCTAAHLLAEELRAKRPVAIEEMKRDFRLVQPQEVHELIEAANAANSVYLFVFQPADLLSDRTVSVAYAM